MDDNEFEDQKMNEEQPDGNETTDDYEVGYGKPPKHSRFQKGKSGNPNGRRKKAPDPDAALLREAGTLMTISDNGRQVRVSKHDVVLKQLLNSAMKGNAFGVRTYLEAYRGAFQKAAQTEAEDSKEFELLNNPANLTEAELEFLMLGGDSQVILRKRKAERESKKGKAK